MNLNRLPIAKPACIAGAFVLGTLLSGGCKPAPPAAAAVAQPVPITNLVLIEAGDCRRSTQRAAACWRPPVT